MSVLFWSSLARTWTRTVKAQSFQRHSWPPVEDRLEGRELEVRGRAGEEGTQDTATDGPRTRV